MESLNYMIETSHGRIAVRDTGDGEIPLLMIHGNSTHGDIFRQQILGLSNGRYRLIVPDLPGHGESGDAIDPFRTYTRSGLAKALLELLETMGVKRSAVLGWSLGGHLGIELLACWPGILGLAITGAPPVPKNNMAAGFLHSPQNGLASEGIFSDEEIARFLRTVAGDSSDANLVRAVRRTDSRFRKVLFQGARNGDGVDQRETVERSRVPLAIFNGAEDTIVNLDYFDSVRYGNLWNARCYRLQSTGHAPFLQSPKLYNELLETFLHDAISS
jgi:pimeloyl-ACP methyl ester carboxylesterase